MFTHQGYSQNAEGHAESDAKVHYTIKRLPEINPEKLNIVDIQVTGEKALQSIDAKRITDESIDRYLMVWKYCLIGQNILRL